MIEIKGKVVPDKKLGNKVIWKEKRCLDCRRRFRGLGEKCNYCKGKSNMNKPEPYYTKCIDCGCTQNRACENGCSWIWAKGKRGLCSRCQEKWLEDIEKENEKK